MRRYLVPTLMALLLAMPVTVLVLSGLQQALSVARVPTPPIPATSLVGIIPAQKRTVAADVVLQKPTPTPIPAGQPAPSFTLEGLDGNRHTLQDYQGQRIVLNFWATWCVPCRLEMPLLDATYQRLKNRGVVIIGINFGEDHTLVQQYVDELQIMFPILVDEVGYAARRYGVIGLPTTFFIDSQGILRDRYVGPLTERSLQDYLDRLSAVDER